jgi:hypothetical protein
MLMPANPVSPFSAVKVERYAPGGGSRLVGAVAEDVEEHAPVISVQPMSEALERIDPSRNTALAHTGLFVIDIPSVSRAESNGENLKRGEKP